MWTQITCLANDEQSIPQRWQRVAVPLPYQCYLVTRITSLGSIWGRRPVLKARGIVARSCITRG